MTITTLKTLFNSYKESALFGRYITLKNLDPILDKLQSKLKIDIIGHSVLKAPIHVIKLGNGPKRVLMWSQMHGNESTTTKAVFDFLNAAEDDLIAPILKHCTIAIVPMLNPDGAKQYTRLNANNVDLNRDAQALSQPESVVLNDFFKTFSPNYCFNLHGQRTIFSAGSTNNVATLSFLSPSVDKDRTLTRVRKQAMEIIAAINTNLQTVLPNQIGRYDDGFNDNCVGDAFQLKNVPTVLFEAGHYAEDYDREVVREFTFYALVTALDYVSKTNVTGDNYQSYFNIPENDKLFYDVIVKNALVNGNIYNIAIQFQERLVDDSLLFIPKVERFFINERFFGHKVINASNLEVKTDKDEEIYIGYENDFVLINNEKKSLKS